MARCFWFVLMFVCIVVSLLQAQPAAPIGCTAVTYDRATNNAKVDIYWIDNSTNETAWRVAFSPDGGSTYYWIGTQATPSSTTASRGQQQKLTWTAAPKDTTLRIVVAAINGNGQNFSDYATVRTDELGAPINVSVTTIDPFHITMVWEEQSTSENGFSIERKMGDGPWQIITPSNPANKLDLGLSNLTVPQQGYSFRVRAFKGSAPTTPDSAAGTSGVSPYSSIVTFTTAAYPLAATALPGQTKINLSWADVASETGYRIYYLPPGGFFFQLLTTVAANATTHQVTNPVIEAGKTYLFFIEPIKTSTAMGQSSAVSATVDGITSKTGASGTPGSAFTHSFTQASAAAVVARSLTGVPAGLVFDNGTGVLSGVCPAAGVYALGYSVSLSNGAVLTQNFSLRIRPAAGAPVAGNVIPAWNASVGGQRTTSLAGAFTDAEADSAVRISTNMGNVDVILFNNATPATVNNFMNYANAGKYTDVCFHRSIAGFVAQTGGFKGSGTGTQFSTVVTNPPVVNEPGISNVRGTVAMAKVGGDPNSATSQFFFNASDNSLNLDYQNGGFTVFGRVAGNGMNIVDAINMLPSATYNLHLNGSPTGTAFADFPMNAATAPATMDQSKLVKILSVSPVSTLQHSVTGNTHPAVAGASIVNGELKLTALSGGQTTVTVTATDLDNLTTSQNVTVQISDTFTTWAARMTFPNGQNGAGQNPDGDALNNLLEYAFLRDPAIAEAGALPIAGTAATSPTTKAMTLQFPVRKFASGITYSVVANNRLSGTWTEIWNSSQGFAHAQVVEVSEQTDRTMVTIKDTLNIGAVPQRFLQLKVVQN